MIRISQLKLPVNHTNEQLKNKIQKALRIKGDAVFSYEIKKRSLDARKKPELYYVYTVDVKTADESTIRKKVRSNDIIFRGKETSYQCRAEGTKPLDNRPVIIGTGPAGLFCGYQLALLGYRPLLLERGADMDRRTKDVAEFWQTGKLDTASNVQFGEGGAGTFSDGKLNTLVKDPVGRNREVLKTFVQFGASEDILYDSKPHIGTDVLAHVIKNMREAIIAAGGEVRFRSQVTDFIIEDGPKRILKELKVQHTLTGETYELPATVAVAAIGHSARDTFETLLERGIPMEAKSFAVGVRIEHPQQMINEDQYGKEYKQRYDKELPAAAYKLTAKAGDGRGVYTFCMCPGGYVVNASSEEGLLAVNGMSYHNRDGSNANSAVIVTVSPEDYGASGALAGIEFQRRLERAAYEQGKGAVPVQLFADFCQNVPSDSPGEVLPQIKGNYRFANVRAVFPEELAKALEEGIQSFDKKIKGYARPDALLSGVESRTSSPVRILRDAGLESEVQGFYPCGEGAGYAGGITSAAMDGLKAAEAVAKIYRPFDK